MKFDWAQAKALFLEARDLAASDRAVFLERACEGEPELRQVVQALLDNDDAQFLETPALGATFKLPTSEALAAQVQMPSGIGAYRVLSTLGEGASGVVYLAKKDDHACSERVAIKVLKHGFFDSRTAKRFNREMHALDSLDHPAIASVKDRGTLPGDARRWFAMEFVDGAPLGGATTPTDQRGRQELFLRIARAVGHAHQRGVVHRDLKPGNILVDHEGLPHVLDFGVARFVDSIEGSLTDSGQLLGTVPYMCPAQLRGNRREVGVRSDVYALGVVGYELFAGCLPYEAESLDQLVRSVCDGRALRLRHHDPRLPPALEMVIQCALDTDPARRYPNAAALADDLENVLKARPIAARRLPYATRVQRFVSQHRGLVVGASIAFVALAGGMLLATSAWLEAEDQRSLAEQRLKVIQEEKQKAVEGRAAAVAAGEAARVAQEVAERDRSRAERVREYIVELMKQGPASSLRSILSARRLTLRKDFAGDPAAEADVARALAIGFWAYGLQDRSREMIDRALELSARVHGPRDPRTLQLQADRGKILVEIGDPVADEILAQCRVMEEVLGDEHPTLVMHTRAYIVALSNEQRIAEGIDASRRLVRWQVRIAGRTSLGAIDARCALARAHYARGEHDEAEKVMAVTRRVALRVPGDPHAVGMIDYNHGSMIMDSDPKRAVDLFLRGLEALRDTCGHGDKCLIDLRVRHNLGCGYARLGRIGDARRELTATREARAKVLGRAHTATLLTSLQLAELEEREGRLRRALELLRPDLETVRAMRGRDELRRGILGLAVRCFAALGQAEEAERFDRALERRR